MASNTHVKAGDYEFDIGGVGNWVAHNWVACLVIAIVAYIFMISRKEGLLSQFLEYRKRKHELDSRVKRDQLALTRRLAERDIAKANPPPRRVGTKGQK